MLAPLLEPNPRYQGGSNVKIEGVEDCVLGKELVLGVQVW